MFLSIFLKFCPFSVSTLRHVSICLPVCWSVFMFACFMRACVYIYSYIHIYGASIRIGRWSHYHSRRYLSRYAHLKLDNTSLHSPQKHVTTTTIINKLTLIQSSFFWISNWLISNLFNYGCVTCFWGEHAACACACACCLPLYVGVRGITSIYSWQEPSEFRSTFNL